MNELRLRLKIKIVQNEDVGPQLIAKNKDGYWVSKIDYKILAEQIKGPLYGKGFFSSQRYVPDMLSEYINEKITCIRDVYDCTEDGLHVSFNIDISQYCSGDFMDKNLAEILFRKISHHKNMKLNIKAVLSNELFSNETCEDQNEI